MIKADQKILTRFHELIQLGQTVLSTREKGIPNRVPDTYTPIYYDGIDIQLASQWGMSCLNLIGRVFTKDNDHYTQFNSLFPNFIKPLEGPTFVTYAFGILQASKDDYEKGYLFETRALVEAEVFDDFLEQARHLLDNKYYGPAAVVAGAVLEDGLRKLCQRKGISLPAKPKLDSMNSELAEIGLYNTLVQKRITALADIRNKAAHGKWSEFSESDVDQMITQVRSFMEDSFI